MVVIDEHTIRWCNAGHTPPLLIAADGASASCAAPGLPLGARGGRGVHRRGGAARPRRPRLRAAPTGSPRRAARGASSATCGSPGLLAEHARELDAARAGASCCTARRRRGRRRSTTTWSSSRCGGGLDRGRATSRRTAPAAHGAVGRVHGARARARRARLRRRPSRSSATVDVFRGPELGLARALRRRRAGRLRRAARARARRRRDQAHVRHAPRARARPRAAAARRARGDRRATRASARSGSSPPTCCRRRWRCTPARATRSRSEHPVEDGRTEFWLEKAAVTSLGSCPSSSAPSTTTSSSATRRSATPRRPRCCSTMGLATQMIGWHEDFCAALADRGFHVIRFDNRDIGRSQHMNGPVPSIVPAPAARQAGRPLHARGHGAATASGCSTTWGSSARTWSAPRWAA